MKFLHLALFFCFLHNISIAQQNNNWELLFNKKDLDNWEQKNGTATYKVEQQEIVGISKMKTPNSFLCTKNSMAISFWNWK